MTRRGRKDDLKVTAGFERRVTQGKRSERDSAPLPEQAGPGGAARRTGLGGARLSVSAMTLALLSAHATSCGNDYPLDATDCDEWCHWYEPPVCEYSDPASCVSLCEAEGGKPADEACAALWDSALECLKGQPTGAHCQGPAAYASNGYQVPCGDEVAAALGCRYLRENAPDTAGQAPAQIEDIATTGDSATVAAETVPAETVAAETVPAETTTD